MKIRIKDNSLRYRLTQSEVEKLWESGFLEARTEFLSKTFSYAIRTGDGDGLSSDFTGDEIVLYIPKTMIDELHDTEKVGFADGRNPVRLLVEKDFACTDNTEEDQSDNYPNPRETIC
jgi:hypothetical protein